MPIVTSAAIGAGASGGISGGVSAGTALTGLSAGLTGIGALSAGASANAQSKVQAEMYARQARRERQIGELNAAREKKKNAAVQAKQRALLAGNNADLSEGSALLVQSDLAEEGELNERLIKNNADANVNTYQTQAVLERASGKNKQTASYFRAGSALLKGASAFG